MFAWVDGYFIDPLWFKGITVSRETGGYSLFIFNNIKCEIQRSREQWREIFLLSVHIFISIKSHKTLTFLSFTLYDPQQQMPFLK